MIEFRKSLRWKVLALASILAAVSLTYGLATQMEQPFHGVGVLKSADPLAAVGETVTYQIKVYNPSDFDLHHINVTDDLLDFNETVPFMAAGNKTGVTYNLHRTVLETDVSPIVNTVHAEAIDSEGVLSEASTQAKTTIVKRLIDLEKKGPDFAHEGDAIKYTIIATNLADSPLYNVTINDELLGFGWRGDLAVGESNMFNLTYIVPEGADDPLTNKVMAEAKLDDSLVLAEATWSVDILHPKLEVDKSVEPWKTFGCGNVTYTINVTNVGDTPLYNLTLVDSKYGEAPEELIPSTLPVGESFVWSFNASVHKCFVNVAEATGVDALGKMVSAHDKAFVGIKPTFCQRSMGYWKNHPEAWPVNEIKIGNETYTKQEALEILAGANAKDATRMLAAQLIAAKLNRLSGASPCFRFCDKQVNADEVIAEADDFLTNHPLGCNPQGCDRQTALKLKDMLDAYNNTREFEHD